MNRPRLRLALGVAVAALAGGCDSYESNVPSCSGQEHCFAYNASNPVDGSSVAGTLVFDDFPVSGDLSGTWAFASVGEGTVASHPTGSGRFTGSSAVSTITLFISGDGASATIEGERSAVLLAGEWESSRGATGPFSASLRR